MDKSEQVSEFLGRLEESRLPVVVDFWAPWCGPCKMIEPILHRLQADYEGQVELWRINADEHPDLLRHFHIFGIPTLLAFQGQAEVLRSSGAGSPGAIRRLFEAAVKGETPTHSGINSMERALRMGAGLVLVGLAVRGGLSGFDLGLAALGGLVAFSAVYDRCPIWQAFAPRASAWLKSITGRAG